MTKTIKKTTPTEIEVVGEQKQSTAIVAQKKEIVKTDADIDSFINKRQAFITKVNSICVEGKDYHVIQGKKSLAKGGAEKIASIFHWTAKFEKDSEALEMLGHIAGLVAFKCTLVNGEFVGEGRGAALLTKNGNDPNKTLKMAQKSAFIDATLRASGLSDFFTQDLENMDSQDIQPAYNAPVRSAQTPPTTHKTSKPASPAQINLIKKLIDQKKVTTDMLLAAKLVIDEPMPMDEAKRVIDWLIAYIPTFGEVSDEAKIYIEALSKCQTVAEYNQVKGEIQIARQNNKLSENAWKRIMNAAVETANKLS